MKTPDGVSWKYEIKLDNDIDYIKEPSKKGVLIKANINFRIYGNGYHIVGKGMQENSWRHNFRSLEKMYDYCYNKSDKTADSNYLNGIVFSESKNPISSKIINDNTLA